jgi:2-polyprenyl-3-methyl-5-hydroxy-6-metoxy-1,4-benzoquinol methylase
MLCGPKLGSGLSIMFRYGFRFALPRARRWLARRLRRRPRGGQAQDPARKWEDEYRSDGWRWLRDLSELGRYGVIAAYVRRLKPGGSVLDVGCGEGVLQEHLAGAYSSYTGIDFSAEAVRRASERQGPQTRFVVADATAFTTGERFDVVILNECLYLFDDPVGVALRYEAFLNPGGLMIVSMYGEAKPQRVWRALHGRYATVDEQHVAHPTGKTWVVKLFAPTLPPA